MCCPCLHSLLKTLAKFVRILEQVKTWDATDLLLNSPKRSPQLSSGYEGKENMTLFYFLNIKWHNYKVLYVAVYLVLLVWLLVFSSFGKIFQNKNIFINPEQKCYHYYFVFKFLKRKEWTVSFLNYRIILCVLVYQKEYHFSCLFRGFSGFLICLKRIEWNFSFWNCWINIFCVLV